MYEVELKFRLAETASLRARLAGLGAIPGGTFDQVDTYYNHPERNFAVTDEALRIRQIGPETRVTYKGPVVDRLTKTRREIELALAPAPDSAQQLAGMLELLSFRRVLSVAKHRECWELRRDGRQFELSLDHVEQLGDFCEIELQADEADRDQARDAVLALAGELGLNTPLRESYLEQLLARSPEPVG